MEISPNTVVSFHYILFAGESADEMPEVENSHGGEPSLYLHGANNILPGLEKAMLGKSTGDSFAASLEPLDAYGPYNPKNVQRVPMKHLVLNSRGKPRAGMLAQLNTSEGKRSVTIIKAGRHSADVDTNHPLAGKNVRFDIEIVDVRAASEDEIAHGHAHGPGGHQH